MASTPLTFSSSLVAPARASSGSSRKPDQNRLKPPSSTWWAPLFGWSSDPDYISSGERSEAAASNSAAERPKSKFAVGGFTEEKARQLRKKTAESSSFHDVMYHSAIASRLASEISEK